MLRFLKFLKPMKSPQLFHQVANKAPKWIMSDFTRPKAAFGNMPQSPNFTKPIQEINFGNEDSTYQPLSFDHSIYEVLRERFPKIDMESIKNNLTKYVSSNDFSSFTKEEIGSICLSLKAIGISLMDRGQVEESIQWISHSLAFCKRLDGEFGLERISTMIPLLVNLFVLQKYDVVLSFAEEILGALQQYSEESLLVKVSMAQAHILKGFAYFDKGQKGEVLTSFRKAVSYLDKIDEKELHKVGDNLLILYADMPGMLHESGEREEAEGILRKGFHYLENNNLFSSAPAEHIATLLIKILMEKGNYADALIYARNYKNYIGEVHGPKSLQVFKVSFLIAQVYGQEGDYEAALKQYEEIKRILEANSQIQNEFKEFNRLYLDQMQVLDRVNQPQKAKIAFEKAVEFVRKVLKEDSTALGEAYVIGAKTFSQSDPKEAERLFKKALEIYKKAEPHNNDSIVSTCFDLAELFFDQEEYEGTINWAKQALEEYEKRGIQSLEDLESIYNLLGNAYFKMGKFEESIFNLAKATQYCESNKNGKLFSNYFNLCNAYKEAKDFEKAEYYGGKALEEFVKNGDGNKGTLQFLIEELCNIFFLKTGQESEIDKVKKQYFSTINHEK